MKLSTNEELRELASTATHLAYQKVIEAMEEEWGCWGDVAGLYAIWLVRAERASCHIYGLPFPTDSDYEEE